MTTTKDLKKLLRESNYEVKVETVPSGVIASFPLEFGEIAYLVTEDGVTIGETNLELPDYSVRVFIIYDILVRCKAINYQPGLISMSVDGVEMEEEEFWEHIPSHNTNSELELSFKHLMIHAAKNNFSSECDSMAVEYGLYDGYLLFKEIFGEEEII